VRSYPCRPGGSTPRWIVSPVVAPSQRTSPLVEACQCPLGGATWCVSHLALAVP
jgi:hypothetical protein